VLLCLLLALASAACAISYTWQRQHDHRSNPHNAVNVDINQHADLFPSQTARRSYTGQIPFVLDKDAQAIWPIPAFQTFIKNTHSRWSLLLRRNTIQWTSAQKGRYHQGRSEGVTDRVLRELFGAKGTVLLSSL
jgi:hypothetical protein